MDNKKVGIWVGHTGLGYTYGACCGLASEVVNTTIEDLGKTIYELINDPGEGVSVSVSVLIPKNK